MALFLPKKKTHNNIVSAPITRMHNEQVGQVSHSPKPPPPTPNEKTLVKNTFKICSKTSALF